MDGGSIWPLIGLAASFAFALWAAPPFDAGTQSITYDSAPPEEPCWTEEVRGEDGLSYGRYGCYHADLAELEKRARFGDLSGSGG